MRIAVLSSALACLAACASPTPAGPAPELTLRDLSGRAHAPCELAPGALANVVVFVTTDCPIANAYAPEIRRIVEDFGADDLRFFVVHVDPELSVERAREHAREYGIDCAPILVDREHALVRALGITVTPEVAVLRDGAAVFYRGRIDDLFADLGKKRRRARTHDLRDALRALREGALEARSFTKAVGCFVPSIDA